jgi:hypothetical protein
LAARAGKEAAVVIAAVTTTALAAARHRRRCRGSQDLGSMMESPSVVVPAERGFGAAVRTITQGKLASCGAKALPLARSTAIVRRLGRRDNAAAAGPPDSVE